MKFAKDLKAILLLSGLIVLQGLNSCDKSAISELDMPEADTTDITFQGPSQEQNFYKTSTLTTINGNLHPDSTIK